MFLMELTCLLDYISDVKLKKKLNQPDCEIKRIKAYVNEVDLEEDTLYYCKADNYPHNPSNASLILEGFPGKPSIKGRINNLIWVEDQLELVIQRINEALDEDNIIIQVTKKFFNHLLSDEGINEILQTAYQFLENPIVITDSTYRLIGLYPEKKLGDRVWDHLYTEKYLQQDFVILFETDRTREKSLERCEPVYLNWSWAKEIPRLSGIIADGEKVFGHVGILEKNREIKKVDYKITNLLCKLLCNLLKRNNTPNAEPFILKQTFLVNLVAGGISSQETIDQAMLTAKLKLTPPFKLIVVPLQRNELNSGLLTNSLSWLSHKVNDIQIFTHEGNLILFLNGRECNIAFEMASKELLKNRLIFGVSMKYSELIQTDVYYRQAVVAVEFGIKMNPGKYQYFYEDYLYQHFIQSAIRHEKEKIFICSEVEYLLEYDSKNLTEYALTLHEYLNHYKNAVETANLLHIHRNTLAYRLNKCEEIAHLDLQNDRSCRHIQLSLNILLNTNFGKG